MFPPIFAPSLYTGSAKAAVPATCGELVQGTLDGVPCLVSCPIDWYSEAMASLEGSVGCQLSPRFQKVRRAVTGYLDSLGIAEKGCKLSIDSNVPRGRGYGSSTADIGAGLYAVSLALGNPLSPIQSARLAVRVEPSDSTLFPGLSLYAHRDGSFSEAWGVAPRLIVVVLDPGGEVDTLAFNRRDNRGTLCRLAPEHREAFTLLKSGLESGDGAAVGAAAALSARLHQAILFNPYLERALQAARDLHAFGVCRAHSGTLLGLLFDPGMVDLPSVEAYLIRKFPAEIRVKSFPLVDGGPRFQIKPNLSQKTKENVHVA